jgi:dTMP kinase
MFITFEGIDGVGKSTQIKFLEEYFISCGNEVITLREPGGTELSEKIRDILLSNKNQLSPETELMLFEAARTDLVQNVIKPALKDEKIVLCDRFFDSTTAYQGYGRGISLDIVLKLNELATGGLLPDITIFLDLPLDIAKERSGKKIFDRMELAGDDFFSRVINGFREIATNNPDRIIRIETSYDKKGTHDFILEKIKKIINC